MKESKWKRNERKAIKRKGKREKKSMKKGK